MSILNKLNTNGSNLSKLDGTTPNIPNFADSKLEGKLSNGVSNLTNLSGTTPNIPNFGGSKLHDQYSLDGSPDVPRKPSPSTLDLNGVTPKKYTDNLPG